MRYARLGDLLVKSGTISEEQLKEALSLQSGTGERLGSVLQEHGIITEKQLIDTLMSQLGVEFVDLNTYHIPAEMAQILPKSSGGMGKRLGQSRQRDIAQTQEVWNQRVRR